MKDKYDLAVEYLTAHPKEIEKSWRLNGTKYHYLFRHIANRSFNHWQDVPSECGCLTLIRCAGDKYALDKDGAVDLKLSDAIKCDTRIPKRAGLIDINLLPLFAEWQRRIDKYYETGILESIHTSEPKEEPEYKLIVTCSEKVRQLAKETVQLS